MQAPRPASASCPPDLPSSPGLERMCANHFHIARLSHHYIVSAGEAIAATHTATISRSMTCLRSRKPHPPQTLGPRRFESRRDKSS